MDMRVPFPQRSVIVLHEPCDRARSMLSHLIGLHPASPNRTASLYWSRDNKHSLRLSHRTLLLELAAFVAASGISHTRVAGRRHAAVFFAQSRYVGPHTQVICYGSAIEASLQRLCNSTARLPIVNPSRELPRARCASPGWHGCLPALANDASTACAAVRAAYSEDWALAVTACTPARRNVQGVENGMINLS